MAGLNHGKTFVRYPDWGFKEGVFYADKTNKWIVRIRKGKLKKYETIAQFNTKKEADECYERAKAD